MGRVRQRNEDALLVDPELGVYIVCDGVGGAPAGDVASQTACHLMHRILQAGRPVIERCRRRPTEAAWRGVTKLVRLAFRRANREVRRRGAGDRSLAGMATTAALVLVIGDRMVVAHVGDSRIHLVREGMARLLTMDHSVLMDQVRLGLLSPGQASRLPHGATLTRAVGAKPGVEPEIRMVALDFGDTIILCSDGLSNVIAPRGLARICAATRTAARIPGQLVNAALRNGSTDNVTAIAIRIEAAPERDVAQAGREQAGAEPLWEGVMPIARAWGPPRPAAYGGARLV